MDSCTDLHINCAVRKVMVRHWIDLGKLSMRTTRGVVRLSGELCRLSGATGHLNCALILTILSELKRVTHVRRVTADFTNWTRSGIDGWTPVATTPIQPFKPLHKPEPGVIADADTVVADGFKVYDVEEEEPDTAT